MTAVDVGRLSKSEVLALRGLRLPALALKRLRQIDIFCDPSVSIQHQGHAQRYAIRGIESGGAVKEMGAYCSFVGVDGNPLPMLQKIQSVGRNGLHAVVVAPELVRLQMFRNEQTYQLLITNHRLQAVQGSVRPTLANTIAFHGINGTPEPQMAKAGMQSDSARVPVFRTRGGDMVPVPGEFEWAVGKLAAAVLCSGCKHCHLLNPQRVGAGQSTEAVPI